MDEHKDVPYIIVESMQAKDERMNRRLFNIVLTVLVFWFLTIAGFIWYITLPVEESTVSTQSVESNDGQIHQTIGD